MNSGITVAVECYIKKKNKYLMLHRSSKKRILPNVWMAPGGKVEFKEGLFEGAKREVFEETGLQIKNIKIKATGMGYLEDIKQELWFFMLTSDYKSGKVKADEKDGTLHWLTKKEILKLNNLLSELTYVLPHVLSKNKQCISYKAIYDKGNHLIELELDTPFRKLSWPRLK